MPLLKAALDGAGIMLVQGWMKRRQKTARAKEREEEARNEINRYLAEHCPVKPGDVLENCRHSHEGKPFQVVQVSIGLQTWSDQPAILCLGKIIRADGGAGKNIGAAEAILDMKTGELRWQKRSVF